MKIVTVIPLIKGPLKGDLTYFTAKDIPNGSIVSIPLRSKEILGLVIASEEVSGAKSNIKGMDFNLRKVIEVKENSIFRTEYLDAILLSARYFAIEKNNMAASLLPAAFRENYDAISKFKNTDPTLTLPLSRGGLGEVKKLKSEKLLLQMSFEDRISVYKTLIRGSFAQKNSIFIVLPTEHDIKIFIEHLSKGIEQFTFDIHSRLSLKKILEKFEKISTTPHPILILGTAPFLSIPRNDIGTIILEHESSTSYRTIQKPSFDLRTFSEIFASKINARFILSDTLLRFETIAREENDSLGLMYPLSFRTNFQGKIDIEDKKKELLDRKFKIFSEECLAEIKSTLDKGKNVFVFALRKGLASMTVCRECGDVVNCDKCLAPLVLYISNESKKRMFACNKCAEEKNSDTACGRCGSWNLMPLGIGTDTVHGEVKKYFPKLKILQLDKETAKTSSGANKIIKEFSTKDVSSSGKILIGTEMAFFYLNDPLPLSIIASFDSLWSIPNYKISERILQLMISLMKCTSDEVIIQTKNAKDAVIQAVESGNLLSFVREELSDRKNLNYPPYKRFIKISHLGARDEMREVKAILSDLLKAYSPEIFSSFAGRQKGQYATNALIKIDKKNWSLPELSTGGGIDENLLEKLTSLPSSFSIFVDPEDLL